MSNEPKIPGLPEILRDIATKLYSYGFSLGRDSFGIWILTLPPGSRYTQVAFNDRDLANGLLRVLREEEQQRHVLHTYKQIDKNWSNIVYGNAPGDTTIGAAGCGPTSLAIVLQYLMNNGSQSRNASTAIAPPETAQYAATHGRVSGQGTAGDPMIRGIREQWPDFDGSRVTLNAAADLLEEGKLIIFLCRGCSGYSSNRPLHRKPDVTYGGHYMVLAGVEGPAGPDQLFYVVDPGRREARSMRFIRRLQLAQHAAGFWWVYGKGEPATRVSTP